MTANAREVAAVILAALFVSAGICTAYLYLDHRPLHRHLNPLDPAPADHGWITPSQPGRTP
jgi:hypothetical protein